MDWNSLSNTEVLQVIGSRLKEHRISKRYTQQELADRAGVSIFTVAQIEKGNSISLSMLTALIRALRLLDNFELLFPKKEISPVELLKQQHKEVKRVRRKKK